MKWFCLIVFLLLLKYWIEKKEYEKTEYYVQTHNSYLKMYRDKGVKGEYLTWKYLKKLDGYKKYLFNCYLPKGDDETTEIDVILLHESGIYVFESKNYSGWIFGKETQQYWTQTLPSGRRKSQKERFLNPIIQNKVHIKWLCSFLKKEDDYFYSYVVFSDRCTLKDISLSSEKHVVINRYNLLSAVKSNVMRSGNVLSPAEIDELYNLLIPLTQVDPAIKAAHVDRILRVAAEKKVLNVNHGDMQCPRCGGRLVLRTAAKGPYVGESFFGCSNYPKCKYIKKVKENNAQ